MGLETGAHFVVFYALVGAVLLFGMGFLYPVHKDGKNWVVDPIMPIELGYDNLYIYPLVLVLVCTLLWVYRQFQANTPFYKLKHILLTLLIYAGCFWLLIGITASAFRMGTIVKTAWFWMDADDLVTIQKSGIYPYGMMLVPQDTSFNLSIDTLQFVQTREQAFKKRWFKEVEVLDHRYKVDKLYWFKLFDDKGGTRRSELSELSDQTYRSVRLDGLERQDRLDWSYRLYRTDRSRRTAQSGDLSDDWDDGELSDLSVIAKYSKLAAPKKISQIEKLAKQYGVNNRIHTVNLDPLIIIPRLPNQIEDAVRSIMHARQFLREGIYWRHFFQICDYLLLLALVLFFSSFVTLRYIFQIVVAVCLLLFIYYFLKTLHAHTVPEILITLSIIGLSILFWMLMRKTKHRYFKISVNMVFSGIIWILFGEIFGSDEIFPKYYSFYGVQLISLISLIGLIAACLVPYVQALPKKQ